MDPWSVIAIGLAAPALLFLIVVAAASGLCLPRADVRSILCGGLALSPIAIVCFWGRDQPWLGPPWDSMVDFVGNVVGFVTAYALVVGLAVATRYVWKRINRRR